MNLVIDLGQSGARIKSDGIISTQPFGKSSSKSTLETLDAIFQEITPANYENIYLSLTGLNGKVKNPEAIGELCNRYFNGRNIAILDDGFAAYYGALGKRNGVVLTIGSGVVAISGTRINMLTQMEKEQSSEILEVVIGLAKLHCSVPFQP